MSALEQRMSEGFGLIFSAYADMTRLVVAEVGRAIRHAANVVKSAANDPVHVAGLEGRYYVRTGLDPAYATPGAVLDLVSAIRNGTEPGMALLTSANRTLVLLAAQRGWLNHRTPGGASRG